MGTWLREDHLPLILSLILFKDFIHNKIYCLKSFIYNIFESKKLFYYFLVLVIFSLLLIKNKYYLGTWGILTQEVLYNKEMFGNPYFRMFFATEYNQNPSIASIFLIGGTIVSFLYFIISILRKNNYSDTLFFILIFSILFPFLFANNAAYAPRYSIIFLPFCILSIAYFADQLNKKYFKK